MKKLTLQNTKKFLSSKIFIAIFFTLFGAFATFLAKAKDHQESIKLSENNFDLSLLEEHIPKHKSIDIFENDPFFHTSEIFSEMIEMQKRMNEAFANHHKNMQKIFDEANSSNKINNKTSVVKKEDDKNYYYELNFDGFKKEDIAVKIENNSLTFTAKNELDKDSKKDNYHSKSGFYYSFSLPKYNEKIEPKITKEDNKVIVKFEK